MDNSRPSIDHGFLSPSGRVSKRSKETALKKTAETLFPPGYWDKPEETKEDKIKAMKFRLRDYENLVSRGVSPRKLKKEIEKLKTTIEEMEK